jgi:hypothetical protein
MKGTMKHDFKVGDVVAWSREFLRYIQDYSAESANLRGEVTEVVNSRFIKVKWDDKENSDLVFSRYIWPADKIHLEPV